MYVKIHEEKCHSSNVYVLWWVHYAYSRLHGTRSMDEKKIGFALVYNNNKNKILIKF